jgi:hypothetical protein
LLEVTLNTITPSCFIVAVYSLFGDSENRGKKYLKIRDLLSIALFNILGTHYLIISEKKK